MKINLFTGNITWNELSNHISVRSWKWRCKSIKDWRNFKEEENNKPDSNDVLDSVGAYIKLLVLEEEFTLLFTWMLKDTKYLFTGISFS